MLSVTIRTDALPLTRRVLYRLSYDSNIAVWWFEQVPPLRPTPYEGVALLTELSNRGVLPGSRTRMPQGLSLRGLPVSVRSTKVWRDVGATIP